MPPSDDTVQRLLRAVADRADVDWSAEEAARPDLRRTLASLRALQSLGASPSSPESGEGHPKTHPQPGRTNRPQKTWGHLEILERIGRGAFGEVVRAYDPRLQVEFALKLALPRRGRRLDLDRFLQEARALARVRHPNVIAIYGADEHDGRLGLWTELLRGRTLEEHLADRGPLDEREAARIGVDVARALSAIHAAALVHRDVTTSNVMREHGGRIVLMDFGAVLHSGAHGSAPAFGTPAFLAPEVLEGRPATARSDLYALGVVLYRMVTASLPYEAETLAELRVLHERQASIPLRHRRPDLPAKFVEVIDRALAARAEARFSNARAMEDALGVLMGSTQPGAVCAMESTSAVDTKVPHNLPTHGTRFIGRAQEIATCAERLTRQPVLTLVGAGGSGKTRLAIAIAEHLLHGFEEVRFVDLASVADGRVLQAVGAVLGLREEPAHDFRDRVTGRLGDRRVLLVLDNCEHVLAASAAVADVLVGCCRGLRLLATSREPLGAVHETSFHVPPLSLPDPESPADVVHVSQSDAVRLFVECARAVRPDFRLTDAVAGAVADVCRRLDGIPLAVELAGARLRLLSVDELQRMLDQRFRLLTDSPFTSLPRHRTLRAALDWSYQLLDEGERRVFRRLAAFHGGWSLASAVAVDAGEHDELAMLDVTGRLVDKSLVLTDAPAGTRSRFRMLESIREFSSERLASDGDADATLERHALHFAALAEEAEPHLWGPDQVAWAERLESDHRNFHSALAWCATHAPARGLALAGALARFWAVRAHLSVGRTALRRALAADADRAPARDRARALSGAGVLAAFQMDVEDARSSCQRGLEIYRELRDAAGMARALLALGIVAHNVEDYAEARRLYAESLDLYREMHDPRGTAMVLNNLGGIAWREGRWDEARALHHEALAHAGQTNFRDVLGLAFTNLGFIAVMEGQVAPAMEHLRRALEVAGDHGFRRHAVATLESAAGLCAICYESAKAARLYGASAALRVSIGAPMDAAWRAAHAPFQDRIARDLGPARAGLERTTGAGLTFGAAIAEALKGLDLLETEAAADAPRDE